jgi:large subunit ribosomal protein L18
MLRKRRVRSRVFGTNERPRLSVNISNKHINAQIINDRKHTTLVSATTVNNKQAKGTMTEKARLIGEQIAKKAKKEGITSVAFDRGRRAYSGRMSALSDAARKEGLEF